MEWLHHLLASSTMPVVIAFVLGLLTAISPCPLATNITAVGYISKDLGSGKQVLVNGILYTLGRVVAYTTLGVILIGIIVAGSSTFSIQHFISKYGEMILPPALIIAGVFILFSDRINLPSFGFKGDGENMKNKGKLGSFLLGILFALAFCPSSGVFYFGMLIPLSATATAGFALPAVFAVATGLPVVIVTWILAYSVGGIGKFYGKMKTFQKWFSRIVGVLFIGVGVYYAVMLFF